MIKKDNLVSNYFEKLKSEGNQYIVNVKGNFDIEFKKLIEIPFQFYHVDGYFYCDNNQLTSLKGCPQIIGGDFYCHSNQLKSLKGGPEFVSASFFCDNNQIKSLKYGPKSIGKVFSCSHNQLISLEYFIEKVNGDFVGEVILKNNQDLLKYKEESNNTEIKNMSDEDFFNQRDFEFWNQFYLQEKIMKENHKIIDDLNLNYTIEKKDMSKPKIKKV